MTAEERELIKAELREELLEEIARKSNRRAPGIETVRKKWFTGPNKMYQYSNSEMDKIFGADQHKVWDAIRTLTRLIFGKSSCSQLEFLEQDAVEDVTERLCKIVYDLRIKERNNAKSKESGQPDAERARN